MTKAISVRSPAVRASLRHAFETLGYEVIPMRTTEDAVLEHVPTNVHLSVTASPAKGQDATVELAERLASHGYVVAPHLSARLVQDQVHLAEIEARCRLAGIHEVFVVGGDRSDTPTKFQDAAALLRALHEQGHQFTDVGIGGHPEGHPDATEDILFASLVEKMHLAQHLKTQIVFDADALLRWAREIKLSGIHLPVRIGIPGAVTRQKLLRLSGSLGLGESAKFLSRQQNLFWRFFVPGGYQPDRLIERLAPHLGAEDNNISGFHIYTFNDLAPTEAWRQRTLARLSD